MGQGFIRGLVSVIRSSWGHTMSAIMVVARNLHNGLCTSNIHQHEIGNLLGQYVYTYIYIYVCVYVYMCIHILYMYMFTRDRMPSQLPGTPLDPTMRD